MLGAILAVIYKPPKLRGKSPGRKPEQTRKRRINYPVVKKQTTTRTQNKPQPA
jgi:hypothetical protein